MHHTASDLASVLESDLVASGWNGSIDPYPGIPAQQIALQMLSKSFLKKFHNEETDQSRDSKALSLFTTVNKACGKFMLDTTACTTQDAIALGEAKSMLYTLAFPNDASGDQTLTLSSISEGFGLGNGANIGSRSTSFYGKVGLGPMTATSDDLRDLYAQAIFGHRVWAQCENHRALNSGSKNVLGSRLSFVPKSAEISRTICTEPVLNMLFQKGIAKALEKSLKWVIGIDLTKQPDKNRKLARIGSETGRFGTIDLSSASDSMSNTLVREFFHPSVVRWLMRTRSPCTVLPDGTVIDLHMVSSMGNAYTFPLQTMFFSAIVLGAYRIHGITPVFPRGDTVGNFAVFGDDIIVEHTAYNTVCRLLSICGFSVNQDKSFNTGLFRESCGHDYYSGRNVRGVYIKTILHAGDCYSAINRLNRWSARHRVPLPNTIEYLCQGLRRLYVPFDEDDSAGIKVPESMLSSRSRSKYTGGLAYQCNIPIPLTIRLPVSSEITEKERRKLSASFGHWEYNPDGLMLALLHGSVRNHSVGHRSTVRRVKQIKRYSSRWDYIPFDQFERTGFGEDWKFFTWLNLL